MRVRYFQRAVVRLLVLSNLFRYRRRPRHTVSKADAEYDERGSPSGTSVAIDKGMNPV